MNSIHKKFIKWAFSVFSEETTMPAAIHLKRESEELIEAVKSGNRDRIGEELADCIFLSYYIAAKEEIDIDKAMENKLEILKKRKWGKPDHEGVTEHIR